jgi:hypothetical protein
MRESLRIRIPCSDQLVFLRTGVHKKNGILADSEFCVPIAPLEKGFLQREIWQGQPAGC